MKTNQDSAANMEYKPKKRILSIRKVGFQLVIFIVTLITFCLIGEINSSIFQAHFLSKLTEQMTYKRASQNPISPHLADHMTYALGIHSCLIFPGN